MKIGFIGNANNYPFMFAHAFRRMGHDVLFIVTHDQRIPLDRPENRYTNILPYPDWIYDASHLELWNYKISPPQLQTVIDLLRKCDVVILNQYALCLSPYVPRPTVALLTGTDLLTLSRLQHVDDVMSVSCSCDPSSLEFLKARQFYKERVFAQRFGIKNATIVNFFPEGTCPYGDQLLEEIGVNSNQRTCFMMTDTTEIQFTPLPNNKPLRVFCATRLTWDKSKLPLYTELDYKGSDIMIKGLGQFIRTYKAPLDIHLVKKGAHVAETMELAKAEGLNPQVTWHEEMSQFEVWEQMKHADIIIEQLGSSMVGMAGLDAMAMGRPIIANSRFDIIRKVVPSPSPICDAKTPDEVCYQLRRLVFDPSGRERISIASRDYVEKYFSADSAAKFIIEKINSDLINNRITDVSYYCDYFQSRYKDLEFEFTNLYHKLYDLGPLRLTKEKIRHLRVLAHKFWQLEGKFTYLKNKLLPRP